MPATTTSDKEMAAGGGRANRGTAGGRAGGNGAVRACTYHVRRRVRTERPRGPPARARPNGVTVSATPAEPRRSRPTADGPSAMDRRRTDGRAGGRADSVHALRLFAMKTLLRPTARRTHSMAAARRRAHTYARARSHTRTHAHTHAYTRTHTRTHTLTYTRAQRARTRFTVRRSGRGARPIGDNVSVTPACDVR